jgi:hypothetical protein
MPDGPENGQETWREWLAGLPSQEELLASYTIEQLLYGVHITLDGGKEECLVDVEPDPIDWDAH